MAAKTDYLSNLILEATLRHGTALQGPVTVYVALFTVAPTKTLPGTEVVTTDTGYIRKAVTFAAASGGVVTNSAATVVFDEALLAWGEVVAAGIMDAETVGHLFYFGALTPSKTIGAGDQASFALSTITVTEV